MGQRRQVTKGKDLCKDCTFIVECGSRGLAYARVLGYCHFRVSEYSVKLFPTWYNNRKAKLQEILDG